MTITQTRMLEASLMMNRLADDMILEAKHKGTAWERMEKIGLSLKKQAEELRVLVEDVKLHN